MSAGVVTVGRHRYAVGLYWENSPGSGRVAQIAKEAARQPGQQADFYAVRPGKDGRVAQFGLSSTEAGHTVGMPVLSACLASQIPGSWAGVFRLNEGIAVTIVRDDLIVPDGDLFFSDEAEARDRLIQEIGFGGLQTIYAPESWSIPNADGIPLTLLLHEQKEITLQRVSIPKKAKVIATILVLIFISTIVGIWYQQEKIDEENAARAQREEAISRAKKASEMLLPKGIRQQEVPKPVYDRKWESAPNPVDVINACRQKLSEIPSALAGWKLSSVHCSASAVALTWNREKGISDPPPGANVNPAVTSATQSLAFKNVTPRGNENLFDPDEITKRYLNQNWPGTIARAQDDPLPPPPPGYTGPWAPPPAPWIKRSFTLNVPELPSALPGILGDIPGVMINSMNYASTGTSVGGWVVEGVIYENRK